METVGTFFGPLVYLVAVWYSLWSFGIFSRFGMFGPRKIWQPCICSPETGQHGRK
jgi:hypothetical protein